MLVRPDSAGRLARHGPPDCIPIVVCCEGGSGGVGILEIWLPGLVRSSASHDSRDDCRRGRGNPREPVDGGEHDLHNGIWHRTAIPGLADGSRWDDPAIGASLDRHPGRCDRDRCLAIRAAACHGIDSTRASLATHRRSSVGLDRRSGVPPAVCFTATAVRSSLSDHLGHW